MSNETKNVETKNVETNVKKVETEQKTDGMARLKAILGANIPLIILVVSCVLVGMNYPNFATWSNFVSVLRQNAVNGVLATGMTFAILIGGIDLSVGAVLAICGVVCASLLVAGMDLILVLLITLALGAVAGVFNGIMIAKAKLQPFIVTMATMTLLRGATLVYSGGKPISISGAAAYDSFSWLGKGYVGPIPVPVILAVIVFAIAYYILRQLRIGRYIYALGCNEDATKYSGIKVDNIKIFVYGIAGTLSAVAAVIYLARLGSAGPTAGDGYELDAIAAVVLGGTSMSGGKGTIFGTIIGVLIIGVLNNALNLMGIQSNYQDVVKGVVILAAVLIDRKTAAGK